MCVLNLLPCASSPEISLVGSVCVQEAALSGSGTKGRAHCHRLMFEASGLNSGNRIISYYEKFLEIS